jgi:transglutaminase-like putative cysteine protease
LYLDVKGKGEFTVLLFSTLIINAYFYGIPKDSNIYLNLYTYISCVYLLINIFTKRKTKLKIKKIKFSVEKNTIIAFSLIFTLIVTSLGFFLVTALGTHSASDIVYKIQKRFIKYEDNGKKSIYSISKSGFGNDQKLGGPISVNKNVAFRVKSEKPYYLRGIVKDFYDGYNWTDSSEQYFLKKNGGFITPDKDYIKYMLGDINNSDETPTLNSKSITIYPENFNSSTLFTPYNISNIKCGKSFIGYTYEKTFMLLNKVSPENYYTISFYESPLGIENFIRSKNRSSLINYDATATNKNDKVYYENNIKDKYGAYLTLPNNISKETYDLVKNIVKDCATTEEKVLKIYEYLNTHYKYSLNVSSIPEGKEFLHHFLFTEKEGYCTYFATAAVVFCRIIGVPARYVEGFNMSDLKDSNGLYIVSNDQAHAWAEILISKEHNMWSILDTVPSSNEATQGYDNIPENKHINQWINEEVSTHSQDEITFENKYYTEEVQVNLRKDTFYSFIKLLFYVFLCILFILPLMYLCMKILKYKKLKSTILKSKNIAPLYYYFKLRLELLGLKCPKNYSESEFIKSIQDPNLKETLYTLVNLYNDEYFGEREIQMPNKKIYYDFIEAYMKKRQNIIRYYLCKYFSVTSYKL